MHDITLSTTCFEVIYEDAGFGELPTELHVVPEGFTEQERALVKERAYDELRQLGLLDSRGALETSLVERLRLLARPPQSVDIRLDQPTRMRGLVACSSTAGAGAWLQGEQITLFGLQPQALLSEVISLLGDYRTPKGRAVSVPSDLLAMASEAAERNGFRLSAMSDCLMAGGVSSADARYLVSLLAGPVLSGQIGVAVRERLIGAHRGPYVIGFYDLEAGRYLIHTKPDSIGRTHTTILPATPERIEQELRELLNSALVAA